MIDKLLTQAKFVLSAAKLSQLPPDQGAEIAFVGRSNAGKSTALNCITRQRIARTSKTPGRTQLINLFSLDDQHRLVDLPGYGFAKVPPELRKNWEKLLTGYLLKRHCLKGLILIMDSRHPLKELDKLMLELAGQRSLSVHILLTKADKLSRSVAVRTLQQVQKLLVDHSDTISVQLFSATTGMGLDKAKLKLAAWLNEN
jgi:GTP-binding protein